MELSLKSALHNAGWRGKLLTHWMGWFGDGHYHPMTAYKSNNIFTIGKQLDVMQAVGIDGVIATWQGPTVNPFAHEATVNMCDELGERGMLFALLLDPWICRGAINAAQAKQSTIPLGPTQIAAIADPLVIAAMNDPMVVGMLDSPAYLPEKFVLDFGTGANFAEVSKSVGAMQFLMRHVGYSWPEIANTLSTLAKDNANPMMAIPGICPKFFDGGLPNTQGTLDWNTQSWGSGASRSIEDQAGNFWHDQVALTPTKAPYAAVVTWNDYNERTGVEPFCSILTGKRIN